MFNGKVQKLRVCEICGGKLSKADTDQRLLEGHFAGKLHIGYKEIREKFAELQVLFLTDFTSFRDQFIEFVVFSLLTVEGSCYSIFSCLIL